MNWLDEPDAEELCREWLSTVEEVFDAIHRLRVRFDVGETFDVIWNAAALTSEVAYVHELAGVLHLSTVPAIDIAGETDLASRWAQQAQSDGNCSAELSAREHDVRVAYMAIGAAASRSCDEVEAALETLEAEVYGAGRPSLRALGDFADAAAALAEWTHIVVETALGYYITMGYLPDTPVRAGFVSEAHAAKQAKRLRADIGLTWRSPAGTTHGGAVRRRCRRWVKK